MKKNELIHLHGLFAELRRDVAPAHDRTADAFREYDEHGVGPNQIHRRKEAHKRAIQYLCLGLSRILTEEDVPARSRRMAVPNSRS